MMHLREVKEVCKRLRLSPSKERGQNFLIRQKPLDDMIKVVNPSKNDILIEIGPGLGALTQELAPRVARHVAVEIEEHFVAYLRETYAGVSELEIVHADALKKLQEIVAQVKKPYKVAGNIPYSITAPLIQTVLALQPRPVSVHLLVQKEVAQKLVARPPHMSLLAVSVQLRGRVECNAQVRKGNFWPMPEVDSAIVSLYPHPGISHDNTESVIALASAGFSHPRKTLVNNLASYGTQRVRNWLEQEGMSMTARPAECSAQQWVELWKHLNKEGVRRTKNLGLSTL